MKNPAYILHVTENSFEPVRVGFEPDRMTALDRLFWLQFGCRESESFYLEPASIYA